MAIFELKDDCIEPLRRTTFRQEGIRERQDLQRLLRAQIEVVDSDVMVLSEEFGWWDDSRRRIDILGLDREGRIVVIELKRTEDGGLMELQALRYAAMVARLTFEQAAEAYQRWADSQGQDVDAERAILDFLGLDEPDEDGFGQDVRIVLVSGDFSKELTTSVLWLNERGFDVRCVRLRLYAYEERVLADVQQVIPLPEAGEYTVQVREKERLERRSREHRRDYTRFDVTVGDQVYSKQAKRHAVRLVVEGLCAKGVRPTEVSEVLSWRGSLWRVVDGCLDAVRFGEVMAASADKGGPAWDSRKWYCLDEELIFSEGQTFALTKYWGRRTEEALGQLLARWPGLGVSFEVAGS